jgi:hypothetical protein
MSPFGIACWPYLNTPDTKFASHGDPGAYKVDLKIPAAEAEDFLSSIEDFRDAHLDGNKAKLPWKAELDENNKETGNVLVRFSQKEFIKTSRGNMPMKVLLIDGSKQAMSEVIGPGSTIRVKCNARVWTVKGETGLTLHPVVVQCTDLKESMSASSDGFDEVDGSFSSAGGGGVMPETAPGTGDF